MYVVSLHQFSKNVQGPLRDRLINKFLESDHGKVDRLIEIYFKKFMKQTMHLGEKFYI